VRVQFRHFLPNAVDFLLDREFVEARKRQAQQKADTSVKDIEGITKSTVDLVFRPRDRGRVWYGPVRRDGLAGPDRTGRFGGVIAHGDNEMKLRGAQLCELIPRLAAESFNRQPRRLDHLERMGIDASAGLAASAVSREVGPPFVVHEGLGHDGTRRVPRAEKKDVVASLH